MPNWCEQELKVTAVKPKDVFDLLEFKQKVGLLENNKILPMPEDLKNTSSGSSETVYDVFYGSDDRINYILNWPWVIEENLTTQEDLKNYYLQKDPNAKEIADKYKHNLETYGCLTWYDWALKHWGTKWGICHASLNEEKPRTLLYWFESAWSPAIPMIYHLSTQYPTLKFSLKYWEMGVGFKGEYVVINGEVIKDISSNYYGLRGG